MWNNDPFLHIKRDVGVSTVQLEQDEVGDEQEEEEEIYVPAIPMAKPHSSRKKTTKLDLKGKGVAFLPRKAKEKVYA